MKLTPKLIKEINEEPSKFGQKASNNDLVKILKESSDSYYNTGTSLLSDEVYDTLKDILEEKDPGNKFLNEVGAPVKIEKYKVKLPFPMGSLTKIKPEKDNLDAWLKSFKGPYILSDKLDGVSAQLFRSDEGLKFYTRGDGEVGQDISTLIKHLIPNDIKLPLHVSVRGEIIMSKKNFEEISDVMKNARNAVAGLVNSKTQDETFKKMIKLCDFVAYNIISPRYKQEEQLRLLKEYGFKVANHKVRNNLTFDLLSDDLKARRSEGVYEVDGIVVNDDNKVYNLVAGNPDYAFAFKTILDDQVATTTVVKVIWEPSMDAYLKPTIQIKPVNLTGTTVTFATAFNAKFVEDNKLGPGAKVKIVRSGDVIPHILEVVEGAKEAQMPDVDYYWTSTHVDIVLQDIYGAQGDIVNVKRLTYFFKTIGTKFMSEGIITKLVDNGYKTVKDILVANVEDLYNIEGLGDKIITKIFDSINESLENCDLSTLMAASHIFGRGMGERKMKEVVNAYPNIMKEKWSQQKLLDQIMKVEGFSTITATKVVENLIEFKKFYDELSDVVNLSHMTKKEEKEEEKEQVFNNMSIVFTGFRDKELEGKIVERGGKVGSAVSSKTSLVVTIDKNSDSSKLTDAKNKGIKILSKDEFIKEYKL